MYSHFINNVGQQVALSSVCFISLSDVAVIDEFRIWPACGRLPLVAAVEQTVELVRGDWPPPLSTGPRYVRSAVSLLVRFVIFMESTRLCGR